MSIDNVIRILPSADMVGIFSGFFRFNHDLMISEVLGITLYVCYYGNYNFPAILLHINCLHRPVGTHCKKPICNCRPMSLPLSLYLTLPYLTLTLNQCYSARTGSSRCHGRVSNYYHIHHLVGPSSSVKCFHEKCYFFSSTLACVFMTLKNIQHVR